MSHCLQDHIRVCVMDLEVGHRHFTPVCCRHSLKDGSFGGRRQDLLVDSEDVQLRLPLPAGDMQSDDEPAIEVEADQVVQQRTVSTRIEL